MSMLGRTIGNYHLVRVLGEGGMGLVFEAEHPAVGGRAAIKVLRAEVASRRDLTTRFFNEARVANSISHPGIVRIFDCGYTADGIAFLAMELLQGESLRCRLDRCQRLTTIESLRIASQIASALSAAHQRQIIHRDLKPDNIMLVSDPDLPGGERAKILDFGISKVAESLSGEPMRTRSDVLMGTPTYMAPEQCRGAKHVTERSDVYSLGVILFQMLAGQPPFLGESVGELIAMHLADSPPALTSLAPHVSPGVASLVHSMLDKSVGRRPTMDEVLREVQRLMTSLSSQPTIRPQLRSELPQPTTSAAETPAQDQTPGFALAQADSSSALPSPGSGNEDRPTQPVRLIDLASGSPATSSAATGSGPDSIVTQPISMAPLLAALKGASPQPISISRATPEASTRPHRAMPTQLDAVPPASGRLATLTDTGSEVRRKPRIGRRERWGLVLGAGGLAAMLAIYQAAALFKSGSPAVVQASQPLGPEPGSEANLLPPAPPRIEKPAPLAVPADGRTAVGTTAVTGVLPGIAVAGRPGGLEAPMPDAPTVGPVAADGPSRTTSSVDSHYLMARNRFAAKRYQDAVKEAEKCGIEYQFQCSWIRARAACHTLNRALVQQLVEVMQASSRPEKAQAISQVYAECESDSLDEAERLLAEKQYERARAIAQSHRSYQIERSWDVFGLASCALRDATGARQALARLKDAKSRALRLRQICLQHELIIP